ncbi:hypothetical protein [Haladaptatus sp. ZSTT2]|uniref:hypothetical protein n=1 Tax=Haladaptatus sp. ZSTT2 TaxID=3120515 RepID=UPI00300EA2B8
MTLADRFGARIEVAGPTPSDETFFLVKRVPEADHETFMRGVLTVVGVGSLVFHHRSGIAVVHTSFRRATRVKTAPLVAMAGPVNIDQDRLRATLGANAPSVES